MHVYCVFDLKSFAFSYPSGTRLKKREQKKSHLLCLWLFFSHSLACSLTLLTLFISRNICPSLPPQPPNFSINSSGLTKQPTSHLSSCTTTISHLFILHYASSDKSFHVFSLEGKVPSCMMRGRLAKQSVNMLTKTWWEQLVLRGWNFPRIHSRSPTVCQSLTFAQCFTSSSMCTFRVRRLNM